MFDCVNAHLVEDPSGLFEEDLYDPDVLFGMRVGRKNTVAENLVEELGPVGGTIAVVVALRERQEGRVRGPEQADALGLGREARQEVEGGEDGVLEDAGEARGAQDGRGEPGQEVAQDDEAPRADPRGGVVEEGQEDRDEEGPLFAEEWFLF